MSYGLREWAITNAALIPDCVVASAVDPPAQRAYTHPVVETGQSESEAVPVVTGAAGEKLRK